MFFQSVYAQYTLAGYNAVQVDIYVNKNALDSTWIGSVCYNQGEDVF